MSEEIVVVIDELTDVVEIHEESLEVVEIHDEGPQGAQGPAGAGGAPGADGRSAYQVAVDSGFVGTEQEWLESLVGGGGGGPGPAGKSAYEVAVESGFVGNQAAWLASLVGPAGADGADGAQGPQGIQGPPGTDGADGAQGPQGIQGPPGADGADGAQGPQGIQGPAGADGANGADGAPGADGADGAPGAAGAKGDPGPTSSGLRMAIIGASIEARGHPLWSFTAANFQRVNGLVTMGFAVQIAEQHFLPGHRIRIACGGRPDIEGTFTVVSCVVTGFGTQVTYNDARADIAANTLGEGGELQDLQSNSLAASWQAHLNIALGGKLDIVTVATGGTNIVSHWGADRVAQVAAQGPFDAVLIGAGVLGNALKAGQGPAAILTALRTLIELVHTELNPRLVFVEGVPLSRDIAIASAAYTAGENLNRAIYRDLQREYPYVRPVIGGEAMGQNYSAYNAAPSADVQANYPEAGALAPDGIHASYGWSRIRGYVVAESMLPFVALWPVPEMGAFPCTRQVATAADPDGKKHSNLALGFWGNVDSTKVALAGTGVSGVGPAGASVSFTANRNTSTVVGSLQTNPAGGTDWLLAITGSGGATGYTFQADMAPAWLLSALNDATVQGKPVDLFVPMDFQFGATKIMWMSLELLATAGGQQYPLAAGFANRGSNQMAAQGRTMDAGFSGVVRFPRFVVPAQAFTAAVLRATVKEVNGSIVSGLTQLRFGPGQRFDVVE